MNQLELKKQHLATMNEHAAAYGERVSEERLRRFHALQEAGYTGNADFEMRERIRDMMMVDTESAEVLKEDYRDLYDSAQEERQTLESQANISGMNKVRNDTLGTKKRAAKRSLKEIDRKKSLLSESKKSRLIAMKHHTDAEIDLRRRQLEVSRDQALMEERPSYEKAIDTMMLVKDDSLIDSLERRQRGTEYGREAKAVQDRFLDLRSITYYDERAGRVMTKGYPADRYFRDMARFEADYGQADHADLKKMKVLADALYVITEGRHASEKKYVLTPGAEGEAPKMKAKPATHKDQVAAFELCEAKLAEKETQMRAFEEEHAIVFQEQVDPEVLLEHFSAMDEAFKMMQVTVYTTEAMEKSAVFRTLPPEKQTEFIKHRIYLCAMKNAIQNLILWIKGETGPLFGSSATKYTLAHKDRLQGIQEELREQYRPYLAREGDTGAPAPDGAAPQ